MVVEEQGGEADEGKAAKEKGEGKREEVGTHERDKVFLCVKVRLPSCMLKTYRNSDETA